MNVALKEFKFLKEENEPKLAALLDQHQAQVIESFGGLLNMIELCLTNHAACQHIDTNSKQFKTFQQTLKTTSNMQRAGNEATAQKVTKGINDNNTNTHANNDCNADDSKFIDRESLASAQSKLSLLTQISKPQRKLQITRTKSEFYHSMMILDCNPKNNLCFRFINVENEIFAIKLYHFILSRIYFAIVCVFFSAYGISFFLWFYLHPMPVIVIITLEIIASILVTIYCISLMLTANIFILKLITNTFDFWFKSYNLMLGIIAIQVRNLNLFNYNISRGSTFSSFGMIMIQTALICTALTLFCVDAIPASINIKRIIIALISLMMTWYIVALYFNGEDYQWNPFDAYQFKYTQISFKSVIISSGTNLIFFVGKPIFADLIRYFRKSKKFKCNYKLNFSSETFSDICGKSNGTTSTADTMANNKDHSKTKLHDIDDMDYPLVRCTAVYKRPFIKWNKVIAQDHVTAIELAEVVSRLQAKKQTTCDKGLRTLG